MFKKNKFGLLVLIISITVFLSGCSQDAYSDFFSFMGGNVYSDDFDLELPGESGAGAEVASEQATETDTEEEAVPTANEGDIDDLESDDTTLTGDGLDEDGDPVVGATSNGDGTATGGGGAKVVIEKITAVPVPEQFKGVEADAGIKVIAISSKITSGSDALVNVKLLLKANSGQDKKVLSVATRDAAGNSVLSIPMFKPLTEESQEDLAKEYSTKNPVAKAKIKAAMKLPEEDPIKLLSAHNAMVAIKTKNATLATKFGSLTLLNDPEIGTEGKKLTQKIVDVTNLLTPPSLSENPTKEEILNVQLSSEISSALTGAIKSILEDEAGGTVDLEEALKKPSVVASLKKVVKNAEAAMAISRVNSDNGDVISGADFSSLLDAISDANKAAKAGNKDDLDDAIIVANNVINGNKAMVRMLLTSYIGIKQVKVNGVNTYVYDASLNNINALANKNINDLFKKYFAGSYLAGVDEDAPIRTVFNSDYFTGLDGLLDYTLSFVLNNIDTALVEVKNSFNIKVGNGANYTVEQLINGYLVDYTDILNAIYGTADVDVEPLFDDDAPENALTTQFEAGTGEFNPMPQIFTPILEGADIVGYVELNQYVDNCNQINLNTPGGIGVLADLIQDLSDSLENL